MILRRIRALVPVLAISIAILVAFAGPAVAESKSDKAILKAGVITKDDVPTGWTSKKSSSSEPDRSIKECKAIRTAIDNAKKKVPRAQSRDFSDPDTGGGTTAQSTVYAFKDTTAAGKLFANFQATDAGTCLQKSLARTQLGKRANESPTVSPITDLAGVGDESVGYELTLDVRVSGQATTAYIDFIATRAGRAFVGFGFTNLGERIPDGPSIVQAVLGRVADAQGSA